jgi:prepilin-type processing-associated H-X9-DG protein
MPPFAPRPATGLVVALSAVLVAVPACKKRDDNPDDVGMDVGGPRGAALRQQSSNNLKMIGIAMHTHNDAQRALPAGIYGPDGKTPGLSWRVAILPYIEEDALYRQFKLDEPWDSEHNKKLVAQCPKVYSPPGVENPQGLTFYRGVTGKGALFDPAVSNRSGQRGTVIRGHQIQAIADGTSNTLMVVEAADAVPWTKPDELVFDPKGPMPKVGGIFRDRVNVLYCDGSVRGFTKDQLTDKSLRAMITVAGDDIPDNPQ